MEGRWTDAAEFLLAVGQALERAGAEFVVLCTNTMHEVAGELERGLPLLRRPVGRR